MLKKKTVPKKKALTKKQQEAEKMLNRISRIEGQLKGVRKMIEQQQECMNVVTQITAIREAVSMLGIELLKRDFICKRESSKKIDEKYLKTLFKMK